MTEEQKSPFLKLHVEEVTQAKRTLLDELNLPPRLRQFIRDNARLLQNGLMAVLVLTIAWSGYDYYSTKQRNDSTAMLAQALKLEKPEERQSELNRLLAEYPRSGAALWGKVALAHELMENKEYGKARESLAALLAAVDRKDQIYPLLVLDLAQACELDGKHDEALTHYTALQGISGFALLGHLGGARMHEVSGDSGKARASYEAIKAMADLDPAMQEWVTAKLAAM
ncbi:MAG: YfgM family protein [Thermodesulfobacteriota bacterium]